VPVVPNVAAAVASGDTTVIFVLDGASPGVPLPNELTVTDVVVQGVPASKRRRAVDALELISAEEEVAVDAEPAVVEEEPTVISAEAADLGDMVPGVCEVGPDGRSVQYVGGNYVGPFRCTFEVTDSRGIIVISDLDLDVTIFEAPVAGELPTWNDDGHSEPEPEPMPEPEPEPPTPETLPEPVPEPPMPEPMPEPVPEVEEPSWSDDGHSSEEATPEEATPEAPLLAGSTAKSSKSSKTHKAHKAKSVKSWKSKGAKAEADERTAEIDGMLAWWEGSGVAFNKDGSSQSAIALENGSSRLRSLRIGAAVAFIVGALACL